MKKPHIILLLAVLLVRGFHLTAANELPPTNAMIDTWQEFRQIHPFGYQTVALKHVDGECVFIISEPSESVTESALDALFRRYGGRMTVKHQPLGYDGWLADAVGCIPNDEVPDDFTKDLFNLLYGTDYKAYYTDLDNPSEHVYFSEFRINYSISAAELYKWFVTDKEEFYTTAGGVTKSIKELLTTKSGVTNELFYSKNKGFVTWVVSPDKINASDKSFKTNARRFALDTDLIIGAFGNIGDKVAIMARERVIPVDILPPLRIETLTLLATTDNDYLAQSFEMFNVFAGKTNENMDMAPIYLSDELWHTEYGNLLNMTDQMLKSWTENDEVHDFNYNYPTPIDWAFINGVYKDLSLSNTLTYNWNTSGAGYVIQDMGGMDIFAVNRTGCLPVSFIPEGMEGKVDERINEAEELAYDFFSLLDSPELAREVQYATFYQIFRYFRTPSTSKTQQPIPNAPNFTVYEDIITNLLQIVADTTSADFHKAYSEGLQRFSQRYMSTNVHTKMKELLENDPYGKFEVFIKAEAGNYIVDSIINSEPTEEEIKSIYDYYLFPSIDSIQQYMGNYKKLYGGTFPFSKAAHFFVNGRDLNNDIEPECGKALDKQIEAYNAEVNGYNYALERYLEEVDKYNTATSDPFAQNTNSWKKRLDDTEKELDSKYEWLEEESKDIEKKRKVYQTQLEKNLREYYKQLHLKPSVSIEDALGTINWFLTDPAPYDAPNGPFYANKFTSHRQWMKSSSITCSKNDSPNMYGGHNLNAHVTPIKLASKAPKTSATIEKGYCCVTLKNGNRVITVAEADKARITPKVLRTIERKGVGTETGQMFKLPKAPKERPKFAFIGKPKSGEIRGLDVKNLKGSTSKQAFVNGKKVTSSSELCETVANDFVGKGPNSVKRIQFKDYSARKVHASYNELGECVVERSPREKLNLNDFSDNIQVVEENGNVKIILEQLPETLPDNGAWKSGNLKITIPSEDANAVERAFNKVRSLPNQQIDNGFKWRRQLNLELQEIDPGFDIYDIKCEHGLFGHIFFQYEYDILSSEAA